MPDFVPAIVAAYVFQQGGLRSCYLERAHLQTLQILAQTVMELIRL